MYKVKRFEVTLPAGAQSVTTDKFNKTFWGNDTKVLGFILLGQYETDTTTGIFIDKNTDVSNFVLNVQQDNVALAHSLPLEQMAFNDGLFVEKQYFNYALPLNNYEASTIENIFHKVDPTTVDNTFIIGVVFEC